MGNVRHHRSKQNTFFKISKTEQNYIDLHVFIDNPICSLCKEHMVVYLAGIPQFRLLSRTALNVGIGTAF